ncbi:hypothetical protein PV325_010632 [Microctonus aethiopoides]|nr:hypothetical protein PV325_010632 [Microctonus aethiopoides]
MMTRIAKTLLRTLKSSESMYLQRGINSSTSVRKHWGPTDIQPIIAVHGWQDNAASFDPLMNYLSEDISVIAIDLPGHGKSSWIPNGFVYNFLLYTQTIERVRQYYNMDKIGIISHSMGGMISFNYACNFPKNMKFVVALDYIKCPSWNAIKYQPQIIKEWQHFFEFEKKIAASPRYKEADAVKISIDAYGNLLNESTCKILLSRGTTKYPDGTISLTRDPRVKCENCDFGEPKELYYDVMKVIENHSTDFQYHIVPGKHYFHMDNPEAVAEILNPFLAKYH